MFKRKDSPASAVDEADSVQAARTRARRRLIGAAVLVAIGIVGFPWLFETQPRPMATDIPIEVPAREPAAAAKPPAAKPSAPALAKSSEAPPPPVVVAPPVTEPVAAAASATAAPVEREVVEAPRPRPPVAETDRDAQRAQAILEGKPAAAPAATASEPKTPRFVVQAGAYTDAATLREARQKVEKLGLKTYTQVIASEAGSRTRVRVGPFESRDEAEKAASRIKSAGLAANVLTL